MKAALRPERDARFCEGVDHRAARERLVLPIGLASIYSALLGQARFVVMQLKAKDFGLLLGLAVIFILAVYVRFPSDGNIAFNIDEIIPIAVSKSMETRESLDPNWIHADLPEFLKYDQYNFYSYNILAHLVLSNAADSYGNELVYLRTLNLIIQLISLALIVDAIRRMKLGYNVMLFGALAVAFSPTMVFDSHIARPESLLYLVTCIGIWVYSANFGFWRNIIIFSVLLGFGSTIKITFPIVGIPLIFMFYKKYDLDFKSMIAPGLVVLGVGILSFVVFAPYALISFGAFLNGLEFLSNQYASGHPPHTAPDPFFLSYFLWIVRFFAETHLGILLLICFAMFLPKSHRNLIIVLALPFVLLVFYFSTRVVFFERNFAHVLPLLIFASAVAFSDITNFLKHTLKLKNRNLVSALSMLVIVTPMAMVSMNVFQAVHTELDSRQRFLDQYPGFSQIAQTHTLMLAKAPDCGNLVITEFDNDRASIYRQMMQDNGFAVVAHYRGPFEGMATSTLQPYLGHSLRVYSRACDQAPAVTG